MKKLFFSAVALVAFSSVSMANTIDIKNVCTEQKEEKIEILNTTPTECLTYKFFYYNHLISQGATQQQASAGASSVYFNCMGKALKLN
ncbi:hypothetical protein [Flavobacterium dankookense]|uniref:Uncharacterized protein n=1 Tax=Flavobacterium dankookense TaxID=706186 RepID=A0A4R6QEK0_9FLAO|nr:hypothetical protein [Flavobacterium dankookense]TDP61316.1 hypothetical protein BC748_0244 [Flavobacterium dankookense]